ncbi:hypothetical protein [Pseudomonas sp. SCT]|uniref:hypothetical protein n=1 Tax=Pseudomonas sp. (strain SCT) TaxID=412955 RepID=UPI000F61E439|nr:hypothetical protein [Pseudomonas sp. SCT]
MGAIKDFIGNTLSNETTNYKLRYACAVARRDATCWSNMAMTCRAGVEIGVLNAWAAGIVQDSRSNGFGSGSA